MFGRQNGSSLNTSSAPVRLVRILCGFSSGEGASREDEGCRRVGVRSTSLLTGISETGRFSGSPGKCLGKPKLRILAGLCGPNKTSENLDANAVVLIEDDGLWNVRSGENMSCPARFRRLAGLSIAVPPGESGRLLFRLCLLSWTAMRNW